MFEKTQKAATDLSAAVTEDANAAFNVAKAAVVPAVAGLFGTLAGYAEKIKTGVESGELFTKAKEAAAAATSATKPKPEMAAVPTEDENTTIAMLRKSGKTDEEIASLLGINILTVKMAVPKESLN